MCKILRIHIKPDIPFLGISKNYVPQLSKFIYDFFNFHASLINIIVPCQTSINEHKTKYMTVKRRRRQVKVREIQTGNYKFETVGNFKYLGAMINSRNDRSIETEHRIQTDNRTY